NNAGNRGAITPLPFEDGLMQPFDLSVLGGSIVSNGITSLRFLTVSSNSSFLIGASGLTQQQTLNVLSNVTIQAGGTVSSDGVGTGGSGIGQALNQTGGGGGYGGLGGASISNALGGNSVSDTITAPASIGSHGGPGINGQTGWGNGGGSLHLTVGGTLQ